MNVNINTKFNIGQKVFICIKTVVFKNGSFVNAYTPIIEPLKILGITVTYTETENISISYFIETQEQFYPETMVFSSLEDAKKWCNSYD